MIHIHLLMKMRIIFQSQEWMMRRKSYKKTINGNYYPRHLVKQIKENHGLENTSYKDRYYYSRTYPRTN